MSTLSVDPNSLAKFKQDLQRMKNFADPSILEGLAVAANAVVNHAKSDHPRPASTAERKLHPHPRFYTWRGVTVAAIHAKKPVGTVGGAYVEVVSPEPHSARLEKGSASSRAFPFMGPALEANQVVVFEALESAVKKALNG